MIAFVRGAVASVGLGSVVLDVGGVGLELHCTPGTLATLRENTTVTLPTSMVVREESLTVFGFLDEDEKSVFEMLQTASGVGPKLAQAMLAVHGPDDLRRAVTREDVRALTQVPGIGQKGAQRIILELKDRIGPPTGGGRSPVATPAAEPAWRLQVREGLVGLGWSAKEADKALDVVAPAEHTDQTPDVGALLRAALRTLSRT
ncbi:MAG: holliday junction helicase RuvA [Nocardioidaceae bacterium]|nr:holliday junction helicase RuvA [Nocardioidaceae bacterium]